MGRKITITGRKAQYEEHRGVNSSDDTDREIRMEGEEMAGCKRRIYEACQRIGSNRATPAYIL